MPAERRIVTGETVRHALAATEANLHLTPPSGERAAAVLAVLSPNVDGELEVVITRRSQQLRTHRGELSFPGGGQDPGESLVRTALREAHEEVGLEPTSVEVMARLQPLRTALSGRWIVPYVAVADARPHLWAASPVEVDEILYVPLRHLVQPGVFWEERWDLGVAHWPVSFFDLGPDVIWGATASMLRDLLARLMGTPVGPRVDSPLWLPDDGAR